MEKLSNQFFKFRCEEGWKVKTFNKETKLQRYIRKNKPLDCYQSLNFFLNPKEVDKNDNPRILSYRTCVDIDDSTKENCLRILSILEKNNLPIDYILQTSENSIQIILKGNYDKIIPRLLIGLDYCSSTLNDGKRVIRLKNSIHRSGFKTRVLSQDEILIKFNGVPEGEIKKVKEQQKFYYRFLRQKVHSLKDRYVLAYKSLVINEKRIRYLQKRNLGDCYILKYPEEGYHIIFPKAIQYSQLTKFQKSQQFIRISKERGIKGVVLKKEPVLFKIIESDATGYYSFPHMQFLRKLGANKKYPTEIGIKDSGQMGGWQRGGKNTNNN